MALTNFNNNNVKIVVQKIKEAVLDVSMKYGAPIPENAEKYNQILPNFLETAEMLTALVRD